MTTHRLPAGARHPLLARQARRHLRPEALAEALGLPALAPETLDAALAPFLGAVHAAYTEADREVALHAHTVDALNAELVERLDRVRRSEARFRALFEHGALGVSVIDADTGVLLEVNPAFCRLLAHPREALLGRVAAGFSPPEDAAITREPVRALRAGLRDRVTVEKRFVRGDGQIIWGSLTISRVAEATPDGRTTLLGMLEDVTERKSMEEQLTRQAFHDPLTGLANRALFRDRVEHALTRAAGQRLGGAGVAVLFLDLDGFKHVNDSLGHGAGDRLLTAVAGRLAAAVRSSDTVARLGGDEFAVLLEDATVLDDATDVAQRVLGVLRPPVALDVHAVVVGASIGVAQAAPGDDADTLLRNADAAMYAAKAEGKGCHAVYDPAMHQRSLERLQLESDLRLALARREMSLHYQPLVELRSGRLQGAEALLRWHHPTLGLVPPAKFIPIAEETGAILELGRWALREACRQTVAWRACGKNRLTENFGVSVNVSGRQLLDPALPDDVMGALADSGLPAACLTLEITESVVVQRTGDALGRLAALKALGVRLAVDDFGTGYSNLGNIQRFPVDVLKIDKSFVDGLVGMAGRSAGKDVALVRTIVTLGQALGLHVVAEGIERGAQRDALRAMGCDVGQGYYFARPVPAELFLGIVPTVDAEGSAPLAPDLPAIRRT